MKKEELTARQLLVQLELREEHRHLLRSEGLFGPLKAHDLETKELRKKAAQACLEASKATCDSDHDLAVEWAKRYAQLEHLSR